MGKVAPEMLVFVGKCNALLSLKLYQPDRFRQNLDHFSNPIES